ncbi:NHLP leader peptide family RiPP precursor [Mesoterricola silvestris]|uniref:Nitrile hydratase alpha/Thiocyanate hydrolase gamma domain-containing protein n=1 Tax=Mesoterricola silvestris TaxID=2927979 RepID=A0AA48GGV5_9BACT|nr:NHLP leader peptide family RiPP precursor [Mesoterricola silvestris]BDU70962.1 hypothetical protein METEAL_01360 [Mesoterricola silvestris]
MNDKTKDLLAALIHKADQDPVFRTTLLADPRKVLEDMTGKPIPEGISVEVHEASPVHVHIVLPSRQGEEGALSESELEVMGAAVTWTFADCRHH